MAQEKETSKMCSVSVPPGTVFENTGLMHCCVPAQCTSVRKALLTLFALYGWSCVPPTQVTIYTVELQGWGSKTTVVPFHSNIVLFSFSNYHDNNRSIRQRARKTRPHWSCKQYSSCVLGEACLSQCFLHPLISESRGRAERVKCSMERWSLGRWISKDQLAVVPVWLDFSPYVTYRSVRMHDRRQ